MFGETTLSRQEGRRGHVHWGRAPASTMRADKRPIKLAVPPGWPRANPREQVRYRQLESWQHVGQIDSVACEKWPKLMVRPKDVHVPVDRIDHHGDPDTMTDVLPASIQLVTHGLPRRQNLERQVGRRREMGG